MEEKYNNCEFDSTPVCDASPDYEAEYYRLIEENKKLMTQNLKLRNTIVGMCMSSFEMTGMEIYEGCNNGSNE